jgi:indole-3-glycerol phosphate synthase
VTPTGAAADLLGTIVAATRRAVEVRQEREPLAGLARRADARSGSRGRFHAALSGGERVNVIAECKRRSPSRGVLRAIYDPVAIARSYAEAGAAAISVLTEPTFFDGSLEHLEAVRAAVGVPVLRKDFIVSEYQLFEARAAGADAALLIVAALRPAELAGLIARADALGLDTLIEVHTGDELGMALDAGARIIGVNNRDLRTLEVDLRTSEALVQRMPRDVVAISESGLRTEADLLRLGALGYRAFLIGERFMAAEDPGGELRGLLERCAVTKDTKDTVTKDTKDA